MKRRQVLQRERRLTAREVAPSPRLRLQLQALFSTMTALLCLLTGQILRYQIGLLADSEKIDHGVAQRHESFARTNTLPVVSAGLCLFWLRCSIAPNNIMYIDVHYGSHSYLVGRYLRVTVTADIGGSVISCLYACTSIMPTVS